jgi:hypothetical protein
MARLTRPTILKRPVSPALRVLPEPTKGWPVPPLPTLFVSPVLQVLRAWRV